VGIGLGSGIGRLGSGGTGTGKLGSAVGSGTGTDGSGGALIFGTTTGAVGSVPKSVPPPIGATSPPSTSSWVWSVGLGIELLTDPFVGDAVVPGAGVAGPGRSAATVAPPSTAPAIAMAIASATSRGHAARTDNG
jgi:hypothetical protein